MSYYSNFHEDFATRCKELLLRYYSTEMTRPPEERYEITLLISIATTGFTIPFERLRPDNKHGSHSRKNEVSQKPKTEAVLKTEENTLFGSFKSLSKKITENWIVGKVESYGDIPTETKPVKDFQLNAVLSQVRNALAHGNIEVSDVKVYIDTLRFYSQRLKVIKGSKEKTLIGYNVHQIPTNDFYNFLLNWFNFLREENERADSTILDTLKKEIDQSPA